MSIDKMNEYHKGIMSSLQFKQLNRFNDSKIYIEEQRTIKILSLSEEKNNMGRETCLY